ncbi:xylulokinase [Nocardioides szechwanensis]|uniref:Xylulose kinase n=1 Tax=Nocardioides szechwanensis TaxID=1005944 RepID=A0A1H0FZU9_9ACTN|nr:FGGY family carbohydrate kinase [Nocardioides szechwanensis]GEP35658.1 xylulokinase [Nocardioides szechwanensis]SDO00198.1 xylulokinase [Nocardioides szechwanensis]
MTLVLGIDSSTQSTKALLVDAADGTVVDARTAPHPPGTEVDPRAWLAAYDEATAGLLERAEAIAVGGQQHGLVALGDDGEPVRDALLWNDTRSAEAARTLVDEMGGPDACAAAVGSVLVASFTASKLRWVRDHEPDNAARVREVLLPHDYVSRHASAPGTAAFTDRGDASGTGYFDATTATWRPDLAAAALGHEPALPRVAADGSAAAETAAGQVVAPGTGDNMAAALGMGLGPGDVLISIGTSGVASAVSAVPVADGTGTVTGFADAQGGYLPMATTLNAARILAHQAQWLGVDLDMLSDLALASVPGAHGATLLPYYGGERTPNRPTAVGTWTGLTDTTTREDLARAAFEALLCSLADAVDRLVTATGDQPRRLLLVGGAIHSPALRAFAPAILGRTVTLPPLGEYVALGAARQASWALAGTDRPPAWPMADVVELEAEPTPHVRDTYARLRDRTDTWS